RSYGDWSSDVCSSDLAVNEVADETLGPDDLMPRLRIDGDLTFHGITGGVAAGIASLAPFGAGNPRPVFAARGVEIIDGPRKLKEIGRASCRGRGWIWG